MRRRAQWVGRLQIVENVVLEVFVGHVESAVLVGDGAR
jgi:hypothetical protein